MADTQVLGTCASACGFKSHLPHKNGTRQALVRRKAKEVIARYGLIASFAA